MTNRTFIACIVLASCGLASLSAAPEPGAVVSWGARTDVRSDATNVVAVAAGGNHSLALRNDGTVVAWGDNAQGQCDVPTDLRAIAIAAGTDHSLGLKLDGTVVAWGSYFVSGGGTVPAFVPVNLSNVTAIAAGFAHDVALKSDGTVVVWGSYGSQPPEGLSNVVAIAAAAAQNLALKHDGTVAVWGSSAGPSYAPPVGLSNVVAISADYYNFAALKSDGSIAVWGKDDYGQLTVPRDLTNNISAIAAGTQFYVALKNDGGLTAWGWNFANQTNPPVLEERILAISSGGGHSLAVIKTGSPEIVGQPRSQAVFTGKSASFQVKAFGSSPLRYQWRFNNSVIFGATNSAFILNTVRATNAGDYKVTVSNSFGAIGSDTAVLMAIDSPPFVVIQPTNRVGYVGKSASFSVVADGSAALNYQWRLRGTNIPSATNSILVLNPVTTNHFASYSVEVSNPFGSVESTNAQLSPGLVFAWGDNFAGQTNVPPDLDNVAALAGGSSHSLALRLDGSIVGWGSNNTNAMLYPWLTNVAAIAARSDTYLVLLSNGTVRGLGPFDPDVATNIAVVAAGPDYHLFLGSNGTAFAVGRPNHSPSPPESATNLIAVAAGHYHSLGIRSDASLLAWGNDFYGQVTLPTAAQEFVDVAAGEDFSLALRCDGTVLAWGRNNFGQTNVPAAATNIIAIAAGRAHVMALRQDGQVFVWGDTNAARGSVPAELTFATAIACGNEHDLALLGAGELRLTRQPLTQTVQAGRQALLNVHALGLGTIHYQWRLDGNDIPGATNRWLVLTNVQPTAAGAYSVVVTGTNNSFVSEPAMVTIVPTPSIVQQPTNHATYLWGAASFAVNADGATPLHYQWQLNGTNIEGATNATLTFTPVALRQAGVYSVVVSNEFGSVISSDAILALSPVVSWGSDRTVPIEATNVVAISSSYRSNLGLTRDGQIVPWGPSARPVPLDLTNVIAVSAGRDYGLAIRANRTVAAWGAPAFGPATNVPAGLTNVVAIAAGNAHSLALKDDGSVVGWGVVSVPSGLTNIVEIAAGANRSLAIRRDGSVIAWGSWSGAIIPHTLSNATTIDVLSMGIGLTRHGDPIVWNSTYSNVPPALTNITQVGAGLSHGLALRDDGIVGAWGDNTYGQTNVPTGLTNVVAIAAGTDHNLALIADDPAEFAPPALRPVLTTNGYAVSFPTRRGWRYRLEYKDSLADTRWTMLPPIPGDGTVQTATDPNPIAQKRFYRVRQQQ